MAFAVGNGRLLVSLCVHISMFKCPQVLACALQLTELLHTSKEPRTAPLRLVAGVVADGTRQVRSTMRHRPTVRSGPYMLVVSGMPVDMHACMCCMACSYSPQVLDSLVQTTRALAAEQAASEELAEGEDKHHSRLNNTIAAEVIRVDHLTIGMLGQVSYARPSCTRITLWHSRDMRCILIF